MWHLSIKIFNKNISYFLIVKNCHIIFNYSNCFEIVWLVKKEILCNLPKKKFISYLTNSKAAIILFFSFVQDVNTNIPLFAACICVTSSFVPLKFAHLFYLFLDSFLSLFIHERHLTYKTMFCLQWSKIIQEARILKSFRLFSFGSKSLSFDRDSSQNKRLSLFILSINSKLGFFFEVSFQNYCFHFMNVWKFSFSCDRILETFRFYLSWLNQYM